MSTTSRGIAFMVLGSALLTANDAVTKWLSVDYPVTQVWCLRAVSVTVLIVILAPRYGGLGRLRPRDWGGQCLRAATFVAATAFIVWGLYLLPLVDMEAIVFSSPILIVLLSATLLGERVGLHRWLGVLGGFAGILLILKPGTGVFGVGAVVAFAAALASAVRDVVTRRIAATEHPLAILNFSNAAVLLIGFAIAPWAGWRSLDATAAALLALNGLFNGGAHLLIIESLRIAEASAVGPYKYSALLWSLVFSIAVFAELPDALTVLGALLVVMSGLYILRREQRATRLGTR
jgi:drug/metabolite transporter (DMT)-like permease